MLLNPKALSLSIGPPSLYSDGGLDDYHNSTQEGTATKTYGYADVREDFRLFVCQSCHEEPFCCSSQGSILPKSTLRNVQYINNCEGERESL